jgi:excisionase family DNA binding protein
MKHRPDIRGVANGQIAPATASVAEALGVAEAAARAGVSRTFLYERISSGELPTVKLGKRRLVRVEALRLWLKSLESHAA